MAWWNEGSSPNQQELSKIQQTGWTALIQDKTIGKKIAIPARSSDSGTPQSSSLNILQIAAPNEYAQQLQLVLGSPLLVPEWQFPGGALPTDGTAIQATGERDNYDFYLHPNPTNNVSWMQAVAVIEWGIGGVQYKAEVDFMNGLCINLVASWVRVGAYIDVVNTEGVPLDGGAYVFSAFIGPGYPKSNNAQRTFLVGNMYNVASGDAGVPTGFPRKGYGNLGNTDPSQPPLNGLVNSYPIPYFAKQASVIAYRGDLFSGGAALNDWDLDIVFLRDVQGRNALGQFHFTPDLRAPCPIPNGAMYFTLHNNLGNPITTPAQVIFDLAI